MARKLRDHWRTLAGRIERTAEDEAQLLRDGSDVARALIGELTDTTAARDLYGRPLAQGLGARLAAMQSLLLDPSLEVNQALRFAVLDVTHVVTLLEYVAGLAGQREDAELEAFLSGWAERMREQERLVRAASVALANSPERAIAAAAPGLAGTIGHGAATAVGTFGEWFDRRAAH